MDNKKEFVEDSPDRCHEFEPFIDSFMSHINFDEINKALPNARTLDQNDLLLKFIKTRDPYEILQNCFYDLYEVYQEISDKYDLPEYNVRPDNSVLVDNLIGYFGVPKKVKPFGFFQMRSEIEQDLESEKPNKIDAAMQNLLSRIFLFYHYTLSKYVKEDPDRYVYEYQNEKKVDLVKLFQNFLDRYQELQQTIGGYFLLLSDFMRLIEQHNILTNYCDNYFQRRVPLNKSQIAEIGMFTLYRNIISHPKPNNETDWKDSVEKAKFNFNDMDDSTKREWNSNWNYVTRVYEKNQPFPPEQSMVRRMISFFSKFLDSISENEIYPKVIVLRSYTVDEYGIHKVAADTDSGEIIFFTDYRYSDFQDNTFTEYYYHSHTNPIGIEPNLVPKDEVENWGILPENQKEA